MDFKKILDNYICKACILSVEKFPDGKYGNIRAVAGNRAHIEEVKLQTGKDFTENDLYTKYLPKSLNFEDYCYRSAILHQTHHSYIEIFGGAQWLEMYLIPIKSDEENIGYCLYTYSVTHRVDTGIMTDVPPDVSKAVLDSCIMLHGTKDFKETINEVIKDIRDICQARRCCVILVDEEARESLVLADSLRDVFAGRRIVFLMSVLADKDYRTMIRSVAPLGAAWVCVTSPNVLRALSGDDLAQAVSEEAAALGLDPDIRVAPDFGAAMTLAKDLAGSEGVVCAWGSLYSVSLLKGVLEA